MLSIISWLFVTLVVLNLGMQLTGKHPLPGPFATFLTALFCLPLILIQGIYLMHSLKSAL